MNQQIQKTSWGDIKWIVRPRDRGESITIGLIKVDVGKEQVKHMHVGDEQVLITTAGEGINTVNDMVEEAVPGRYTYFPPYAMHTTTNTGSVPLEQIMISTPIRNHGFMVSSEPDPKLLNEFTSLALDEEILTQYIAAYLDELDQDRFVKTQFNLGLCDAEGEAKILYEIPDACRTHCGICHKKVLCPEAKNYITENRSWTDSTPIMIECSYGFLIILSKIYVSEHLVGYLQACIPKTGIYMIDTTRSGIVDFIQETSIGVSNSCMDRILQYDLKANRQQYAMEQNKSSVLSNSLKEAQDKILSLNIKNHFLFNTLNSIAAMSLRADRVEVYQSIVNLSQLFRNQLQKTGTNVSLKTEFDALKPYMELMQLRFTRPVHIHMHLDRECEDARIPFNTIQPVVENCFVHGFSDESTEDMKLSLVCRKTSKGIQIIVRDNGRGMKENELRMLRQSIQDREVHGLGLVAEMLQKRFGDDYSIEVNCTIGSGTEVIICFPLQRTDQLMTATLEP